MPSSNVFDAVAQTAVSLESSEIVLGDSAKFAAADQARLLGESWERVKGSEKLRTRLLAYKMNGDIQIFQLGPHLPTLTLEDLDVIHRLWLDAVGAVGLDVHHRDIVRAALEELDQELRGSRREQALKRIRKQTAKPPGQPAVPAPPGTPGSEFSDPGAI